MKKGYAMRLFLLVLLFIEPGLCAVGQAAGAQKPLARKLARIPFRQFSGGVIVVDAQLASFSDTLHFILDTGSGGISFDSTTCAQLGITSRSTDTTITGLGGARKVRFAFGRKLQLGSLKLPPLDFHINNYEILSSVYGEKIDGIIGYSFFSRYIASVNFDSSFIDVFSPGVYRYPKRGYTLTPAFTALPIVHLDIEDRRKINSAFFFDTGAGLCFLMSEAFAQDSGVLLSKRKPLVSIGEGMSGRLRMKLTVVKKLRLGKYRFRNVPAFIFDDEFNVTAYPFVSGLLGNDLLRRFNLVVNYPERQIHLLPNSHYREDFDYGYTGMSLYAVDAEILVDDVIAGSPADKAGLIPGDRLVGVGNNFSGNLMQYKTQLQQTGRNIPLVISRNGQLQQRQIRPLNIKKH